MKQILIVCTGNICRSPIAEGIIRFRSQQERISHKLYVHSAGTHAVVGSGASRNGVEVMAQHGVDMRRHVAKQVSHEAVSHANLIITMEEAHRVALFNLAPQHFGKVILLSELSGRTYDIPDPYGGPLIEYQVAYARINGIISAAWDTILDKINFHSTEPAYDIEDEETSVQPQFDTHELPSEPSNVEDEWPR